jgi:CheY-like chemotaxis protein
MGTVACIEVAIGLRLVADRLTDRIGSGGASLQLSRRGRRGSQRIHRVGRAAWVGLAQTGATRQSSNRNRHTCVPMPWRRQGLDTPRGGASNVTQPSDRSAASDLSSSLEDTAYPGAGRKLLLVDDDGPLLRSMARALKRRGFAVIAVESLAEARDRAPAHCPQYAVLDMRLADGNGLDLVPFLREIRPEVRIVVVTGYGNVATAVSAIKAISVSHLAKPVDAYDVVAVLLKGGHL